MTPATARALLEPAQEADAPIESDGASRHGGPSEGSPRRGAKPAASPPRERFTSLRVIIPCVAALLLAGALVLAAMIAEHNARVILVRELETRLVLQARNIALTSAGALLEAFPELTLQPIVTDLLAERPELTAVMVVGPEGTIRGHPDLRSLGHPYRFPAGLRPTAATIRLKPDEKLLSDEKTILVATPVALASGQRLGQAIVAMRRDYLEHAIAEARRRQWVVLGSLLVIGSLFMLGLISQMLRPVSALREGLERIGRGNLDTPLQIRDHTEFGLLAQTMNRMATQLKVPQGEALEKERLAGEIALARNIQQSLLPAGRMEHGAFVMVGSHYEAEQVGGDYFDLLPLPNGSIGLAVADVSGKGLKGCMIMAMLLALLHMLRALSSSPKAVLIALEENLGRRLATGTFIIMF